jgi:ABC-type transport system substrate-binding protein
MLIAVLVVVLFGIPAIPLGGGDRSSVNPVGQASASGAGDRVIRIGEPDFTQNMATLNPLVYTENEEMETIWLCYDTLLMYDVNKNVIGDLVTSWDVSPDGTLWHFKITTHATFYDRLNPTVVHPLTAADVIYTYYLVQNNTNSLQTYLPMIRGQFVISRMWAVNNFEFYIQTSMPYAPMRSTLISIPILPEYIWSTQKFNWQNFDTRAGIPPIVGSGPFYYALSGLPTTGTVELDTSPTWFATQERGWQLHVSKLIYKSETSTDTALSDLRTGAIDIDAYPSAGQYLVTLPGMTGVDRWSLVTGGLYEFNMNQMTDAERAAFGGKYKSGSSNQLLQDPVVKTAMQMCLDKQSWVDGFLSGLAAPADSLIGPKNEFHYDYGSRPGETPFAFDPAAARAMLNAAGWTYDLDGNVNPGATPLCKLGKTDPLKFRFWTLNDGLDQSNWGTGAVMISDWAWEAGIDLKTLYSQQSMSFMNGAWAAADYDCWLWDWWFGATSEASSDIMSVLTTGAIGSWSDVYWMNATFNNLYNESLIEADFATRYSTLADMQAMAYEESGCVPLAYRAELFAATNQGPDQWTNWGNWTQTWLLEPGELPWLYMQIYPVTNHAPTVTVGQATFSGNVNTPIPVYGSATDASNLQYQWYWGDGSESGWLASASTTHTYAVDGVYDVYFGAQEVIGTPSGDPSLDGFICSVHCKIVVVNPDILPPIISSIWMSPSTNIQMWTVVKFQANATGTPPLSYSWNFGDGYTGMGRVVNHTFSVGGSYLVVLKVDDGHPGQGRPAVKTQSVSVIVNTPPTISIMSSQTVIWKTKAFFNASAYDSEDALRFTWVWGDGSKNVTTSPKLVTHTYTQKATYNLNVYADDLTGLPGHNVSATCKVTVEPGPSPPFGLGVSVNRTSIWVSQSVAFTAVAQDPAGDGLHFSVNCGDGTYVNVDTPGTANNVVVTATLTHTYMSAGTFTARLYVTDGLTNTTGSTPVLVTVTLNHPPVFTTSPANKNLVWAGNSSSYTATAFDSDAEAIRYTWNFGDGSALVVGQAQTHVWAKGGTFTVRVYADDLTRLVGHNVSAAATARIAHNLPLLVGWNFVSVPLVGYGYKASNISLATGDMISSWNSATQKYDHTYIKGISPPILDFAIAPNAGYWIWVASAKTIHLYGSTPTATQTVTITVPSVGGWVVFGMESMKSTFHAKDINATMWSGTGHVTLVAYFNAATGKYVTWITALPLINNFALAPGVAYWLWVSAGTGGTLSYTP